MTIARITSEGKLLLKGEIIEGGNIVSFNTEGNLHCDELLEEGSSITIENEVVNGNFEEGVEGWGTTLCDATVQDNTLTKVSTGVHSRITQTIERIVGDKYYYTLLAKTTDNTIGIYATQPVERSNNHTGSNEFERISVIHIPTHPTAEIRFGYSSTHPSLAEVKEVMVINLTKTFGVGNEPSVGEMDSIIDEAGWFDDQINWVSSNSSVVSVISIKGNGSIEVAEFEEGVDL